MICVLYTVGAWWRIDLFDSKQVTVEWNMSCAKLSKTEIIILMHRARSEALARQTGLQGAEE